MKTVEEYFEDWLDGVMAYSPLETRREFAKKTGTNFSDLRWAFVMGYVRGQESMMERK
jgi:hypothetical protein